MDTSPWPGTTPVVFLCDISTPVERSLLTDWVRSTQSLDGDTEVDLVDVPLDNGRQPDDRALLDVLDRPGSTTLVPLRVAWVLQRDPRHSGPRIRDLLMRDSRQSRSRLARLVRSQDPQNARCVAGAPATIDDLRRRYQRLVEDPQGDPEPFDAFVLRQAGIALDVAERKLQGRRYKVPRAVVPGIEGSARYRSALAQAAASLGRHPREVQAEARQYFSELVATPSVFFIDYAGTLARWIVSLGYREVVTDPGNLERARAVLRDHPSALLWTHKSHVDAIALLSVMYENDFPAAHSIGGINMAFTGVAYAGRRSGTIYIRRSFSDNPVYKMALQQYLGYLMEKRFPLSWAFEGTRSRNGKLGPPRYGMLKYVIDAAHATQTRNLHLIPVSISYDLIGETPDYAREDSGQPKQAENLGWFMEYLHRLRSPMGNVYLDFAEPVVLEGPAPQPSDELLQQAAFEVARRVNDRVPVTLPSLMCLALLGAAPRAMTYAELDKAILGLLGWLRARDIRLARSLDSSDVPELESLAENVFQSGVVERVTEGHYSLFSISEDKYPVASYYRNTIVHYFVNKAIAEVALATVARHDPDQRTEDFLEEVWWLRDLTKFEFFHTPSDGYLDAIDTELSSYDGDWREVLAGSHGDVVALLAGLTPLVSHAVLLPYLEAYWLVARVVAALPPDGAVNESETIASALRLGRIALRQRRIASQASIGKAVFKGAISYLDDQGLLEPGEASIAARRALATRLDRTLSRVRQIAEMAHTELFTEDAGEVGE